MYTVWHVDKYKITFKLVINHRTNEILQHIVVSSGLSWPGVIDARVRYRTAARRLRNTGLGNWCLENEGDISCGSIWDIVTDMTVLFLFINISNSQAYFLMTENYAWRVAVLPCYHVFPARHSTCHILLTLCENN